MENFKNDDDLKPFFDALRQNPNEPMSLDMVREKVDKIHKSKKSKNTIMNISLILSITAAIALFNMHSDTIDKNDLISSEPVSAQKTDNNAMHQNDLDKLEETANTSESKTNIENEKTVKPPVETQYGNGTIPQAPLFTFMAGNGLPVAVPNDTLRAPVKQAESVFPFGISKGPVKPADPISSQTNTLEFPFPVVRLSVEELEKLGIYSGGNGIFFESVKYSDKPFQFYYLPSLSSMSYSGLNIRYKQYFPVMMTDRYFQRICEIPYHLDYKVSVTEKKAMTKDLIPVIAYANSNPKPTFYNEQIFWFKKTEDIIALMPLRVQQEVRDNKYIWDLTKDSIPYTPEALEIEKSFFADVVKHNEGMYIPFDSAYAIHADQSLLNKLNFTPNTFYVEYEYKTVQFGHQWFIDPETKDTTYNYSMHTGKKKHITAAQKKQKTPLYKFGHPLPFTPSWITDVGTGGTSYTPCQNYMLQKHALIPVIITGQMTKNKSRNQHVFWYYPTPNFMSLLNPEQLKTANLYLKKHKNDSMLLSNLNIETNYPIVGSYQDLKHTSEPAFAFTKLEFDSLTLRKLGIVVHDKSVSYFFSSDSSYLETNFSKKGTQIHFDKKDGATYASKTALIITDDLGRFPRMSLDSATINTIDFNTLVPVYVKTNDDYTNMDKLRRSWRPDVIFWYKPDSAFLASLPQQIAIPMASDVRQIESKTEGGSSCIYFDACKTQTPTISSYKFYPNPATHYLNIDLKTSMATTITVQLFDMEGKAILQQFPFETNENKLNSKIDISQLPPGIYNLVLETGNGDKIITRIIVMH